MRGLVGLWKMASNLLDQGCCSASHCLVTSIGNNIAQGVTWCERNSNEGNHALAEDTAAINSVGHSPEDLRVYELSRSSSSMKPDVVISKLGTIKGDSSVMGNIDSILESRTWRGQVNGL